MAPSLAILIFSILASVAQHIFAIESKCSACQAVASELQRRLDLEAPKNHLDFRGRLDGQGNRYGKVVEYRVSELRAVELLDDLCDQMRKFTLITQRDNDTNKVISRKWTRILNVEDSERPEKAEEEARIKHLKTYCGGLIEDFEEDIITALKEDDFEEEGVEDVLCVRMVKHCKRRKTPEPAQAVTDDASASAPEAADIQDGSEKLPPADVLSEL